VRFARSWRSGFGWSSRKPALVESRTIYFIGCDMLLRNKLAAGRPKDLAYAARLKATTRPTPR
jgi:hypothetical protein